MGEIIPLTGDIGIHLPEIATTASGVATAASGCAELVYEVRALLALIDDRRRRGWAKVPFYALYRLRALVGVPEPEPTTTTEEPER